MDWTAGLSAKISPLLLLVGLIKRKIIMVSLNITEI